MKTFTIYFSKVVEFVHPKDLFEKIDLEVRDFGESDDKLLNLCRETIHYSVKSGKDTKFQCVFFLDHPPPMPLRSA